MEKQSLISFHLPKAMLRDLDEAVRRGVFKCRSEAVREAIRRLLLAYGLDGAAPPPPCNKPVSRRKKKRQKRAEKFMCNGFETEPAELWRGFLAHVAKLAEGAKTNIIGVVPYKYVSARCRGQRTAASLYLFKKLMETGCAAHVAKRRRPRKILLYKDCILKLIENPAESR